MSQIPPDSAPLDWLDDPFEPAEMPSDSTNVRKSRKSAPLGFDDLGSPDELPAPPVPERSPVKEKKPIPESSTAPAVPIFSSLSAINGSSLVAAPPDSIELSPSPFPPLPALATTKLPPFTGEVFRESMPRKATPIADQAPVHQSAIREVGQPAAAKSKPVAIDPISSEPTPMFAPIQEESLGLEPVRLDVPPLILAAPSEAGPALPLFDPLFQYMCRLNRLKRTKEASERFAAPAVHDEVERIFEEISTSAQATGQTETIATLVPVLKCWVDVLITRTGFPFADDWRALGGNAPDKVILDAAVAAADDSRSAPLSFNASLIHACLCFSADLLRPAAGGLSGNELLEKLDRQMRTSASDRVCPRAYDGVFTRVIMPPVGDRVRMLLSVGVGVLLLAIAGAVIMNLMYETSLESAVKKVIGQFEQSPH